VPVDVRSVTLVLALVLWSPRARAAAEERPADEAPRLGEVVVEARKELPSASSEDIRARDLELRPHSTGQEILNDVPGLVAVQHQGGGKAPQWLLRGFDADHGTDVAVFVDDLPINLRTHAHGQGYADLNPLIPEVVETIQVRKGPYFVQYGDFATAGTLDVITRDRFKENFVLAEGGSFDTMRYVGGVSRDVGPVSALVAGQAYFTDGPFENPEDFARYNAYTKLSATPSTTSRLWLSGSVYDGRWHGSGQIPLREVSAGRLDRFGAVDPTEGGHSDREDLTLHYDDDLTARDRLEVLAYGSRYELQLFSDFTFFKDTGLRFTEGPGGRIFDTAAQRFVGTDDLPTGRGGSVPGDGIEQNDQRYLYGGRIRYRRFWDLLGLPGESRLAVETRNDDVNLALHRQVRRNRFFSVNALAVSERSVGAYLTHEVLLADRVRLEVGLRGDVFFVDARNRLARQRSDVNFDPVRIAGGTSDSILSPKAALVVTPIENTDVYLDFGEGFHSNDARDALTSLRSGRSSLLTKALGYELGARTHPLDRLDLAAALWLLDLDSELVFSGDAGNQETGSNGGNLVPSPPSRRWGVDFEGRYQVTRWLSADYDLAWADAYFTGSAPDRSIVEGDAVPLAPTLLMNGGLTAALPSGFSVALRTRFLDDRPAIEDRSLVARGYTLLDLIARYRWRSVEASLALLNLTDAAWREAQFADNSCVRRELGRVPGCDPRPGKQTAHAVEPPSDIHFTPGNPFGVRAGVKVLF
jgi:outer membrane receptor protein involved in Fe transport